MKEYVLVLFKPDVMAKGLMGHLLSRFSEIELDLVAMKIVAVPKELAEQHYSSLQDKPFYGEIVDYLRGKLHGGQRVAAFVYAGENAIRLCRGIAGATNPEEAHPKTIRGSMGRITTKGVYENAIHVSSDRKEAEREIKLWFTPDDLGENAFPTRVKDYKAYKNKIWA